MSRVVKDTMLGLRMPDIDVWSDRVVTVLGQNPGPFTGPGTNTYLVGTSRKPILLDTGQGKPEWPPLLERALDEQRGSRELQEVVLTHAHPDHLGGYPQVRERFGRLRVSKRPWPGLDGPVEDDMVSVGDGATIATEGATLRAIHTPGHAEDHLCWWLEEERAVFTGDVVLGAGTTVIPEHGGDLLDYMSSLRRLLDLDPAVIYPAHGPVIRDAGGKIREYIAHRELRERQIVEQMAAGVSRVPEMVKRIYADVPEFLHAAAGSSVRSHLRKLEREGRARRDGEDWSLAG
ncbi:MAG TPA: MBL fold metallo-hydrolase [Candidatus Binatia bacterium]|nr:MBL fold metallo-hydrolase [Candidatus Binatia bacterium]